MAEAVAVAQNEQLVATINVLEFGFPWTCELAMHVCHLVIVLLLL